MDPELKEFNSNRQGMFDDDVIESQLDPLQMIQLLKDAGWKDTELQRAFEIAYLESKHRPLITHELKDEGDLDVPSIGLFQITDVHAARGEKKYGKKWRDALKDPMENAKFALELYNESGWEPWAANDRIENLLGYRYKAKLLDADGSFKSRYPSEHYYELGRTGQKGYDNTIKDWNHAKDLYRATSGLPLNPLRDKYKKEPDGSYKFFNEVPTDRTTSPTPPFERYMSENPEERPMQEPQSAFTNPDTFVPQFVRDGTSQQTDPRQAPEFQPNFVTPNTVQ